MKVKVKKAKGNTLTVFMGDRGDMSVGIWPTNVEITFKANVEFKNQIDYKENRELFRKQIQELACWFTDMPVQVVLEDECQDCGEIISGQSVHQCQAF